MVKIDSMARVKLKIGKNEVEIDSRDFYVDNQTMGDIIEKILQHLPENKAQIVYNDTNSKLSQDNGLDILDDAEIFEPEFSKPKPIGFSEIKSKLLVLETTGFFESPHSVGEIVQQLREYGWAASLLDVSKVLSKMASKKELSKISQNDLFYYAVQSKSITI